MMIIFRKIKVIMVTVLGIFMLLIGIPLTVFISQNPQAKRQHAIGLGNIVIDYTSPMWKLDPTAIGMDLSGYGYPHVFAHDLDAANMVKHFNKDTNNYVRYRIVGNEPDQAGISAATYSAYFNQDFAAMKAIDPTIKIGGGATAFYDAPFLQTFLQQSGSRVDFVDFHGYAQEGNAPGDYTTLFQIAAGYGNGINNLRSLMQQIVPARASQIGIEVGERELNWGGTSQNNTNFHAVWAALVLGHILRSGGWSLF
jgi:hypothetical protein